MIYKVCDESAWNAARQDGNFLGTPDDLRDGFIHLSTASQLRGTLDKHYSGRTQLVLVAVDPQRLGPTLRWEPARDGALFPHLYVPLQVADVAWVAALPLGNDGRHQVPDGVA